MQELRISTNRKELDLAMIHQFLGGQSGVGQGHSTGNFAAWYRTLHLLRWISWCDTSGVCPRDFRLRDVCRSRGRFCASSLPRSWLWQGFDNCNRGAPAASRIASFYAGDRGRARTVRAVRIYFSLQSDPTALRYSAPRASINSYDIRYTSAG